MRPGGTPGDPAARPAARAARLLRWYPKAWRARYGDEFAELLIADIEERPRSAARTLDVVRGGTVATSATSATSAAMLAFLVLSALAAFEWATSLSVAGAGALAVALAVAVALAGQAARTARLRIMGY